MPVPEPGDRDRSHDSASGSDPYLRALGRAVRIRRVELDLNQAEFAPMAGLSAGYLSTLECGRRNPGTRTIWRLAEALNMTAGELLNLADELRARDERRRSATTTADGAGNAGE